MTTSVSPGIRNSAFIAVAVMISAILLVFFLPDRGEESPMHAAGSTFGRVLVDSPEVYTRERMVNDRFRQEAWLLEQLKKLTEEEAGVQGFVDGQKSRQRSMDLKISQGGAPSSEDNDLDSGSPDAAVVDDTDEDELSRTETGQPQLTPIEVFRGRQAFGEEIRNAIIENQLDDRHDLGGNTLYRLKFDATVIPGSDTSAWAWINVRLQRTKGAKEDEELWDLYERWMDELRERVNLTYGEEILKTADENAKQRIYQDALDLLFANLSDELLKDRDKFEDQACTSLLDNGNLEYSAKSYECVMKALPLVGVCAKSECEKMLVQNYVLGEVIYEFGTTLGQKGSVKKRLRAGAPNQSNLPGDVIQGQRFVSFTPDIDGKSVLVEEYKTSFLAVPVELNDNERALYNIDAGILAVPMELVDSEREAFQKSRGGERISDDEILNIWTTYLTCDESITIRLKDRLFNVCPGLLPDVEVHSAQELPVIEAKIAPDWDGQPRIIMSASDETIQNNWVSDLDCKEQPETVRVQQRLFKICAANLPELEFAKRHAGGLEAPAIVGEVTTEYDGQPRVTSKVGFLGFKKKLEKSDEKKYLFSYAVTPRESSQQLASSSRLALSEQVQASASGSMGAAGGGAGARRSSLFSEYARIMERRPVVVGVAGRAGPADGQVAEFGWLIGPKLVVGPDGMTTYRHLPSQNSLAALVSAPSWWRRANIEIETGWLDEQGNPAADPIQVKYEIALPGDQDEITSKLLLGGKRPDPRISGVSPMAVKVNEEAKILIEGHNLWRSTVVTIGAQSSKRIFVLPNMKGIIAEFDAIDAQATRPGSEDLEAILRVWTSEGVALGPGITIEKE